MLIKTKQGTWESKSSVMLIKTKQDTWENKNVCCCDKASDKKQDAEIIQFDKTVWDLIEPQRGGSIGSIPIPCRSRWPRSLTGLEYSKPTIATQLVVVDSTHSFVQKTAIPLHLEKHGDFNPSTSLNGLLHPTTPCWHCISSSTVKPTSVPCLLVDFWR